MEIKVRTLDETRAERVTIAVAPGQRAVIEIVDSAQSGTDRLYTNEEVAALQASEAELVAKPLRARIAELVEEVNRRIKDAADHHIERDEALDKVSALETHRDELRRQLATAQHARKIETDRADAAEKRVAETEEAWRVQCSRVGEYDRDRHTEQARADQNREWAERAEKHLDDAVRAGDKARADLAEAQRTVDVLARELGLVKAASKRRALKLRAIGKLVHGPNVNAHLGYNADSEHYDDMVRIVKGVRQALITPPTPPAGE